MYLNIDLLKLTTIFSFIVVFSGCALLGLEEEEEEASTSSNSSGSTTSDDNDGAGNSQTYDSKISAFSNHTCIILSNGTVKCWGIGLAGAQGDGSSTVRVTIPVTASGVSGAVDIATGWETSCALLSDYSVKCWGGNTTGSFGDGTIENTSTPVNVSSLSSLDIRSLTGGYSHICGLLNGTQPRCWGDGNGGQLGDGNNGFICPGGDGCWDTPPVSPTGISSVSSIAPGNSHTCFLLDSSNTVKCTGVNSAGQLGDGTTTNTTTPVQVSGLSGVAALATGYDHTCALLSDKTVKCWGENDDGQLGDGSNTSRSTPVLVDSLSNVTTLAAGAGHTCALLSDKTVKCWGKNDNGQLGDGSNTSRNTPVEVSSLSDAAALVAGADHTCALLVDDTVKCWGGNTWGQLGNNSTNSSSVPVSVSL